MSEKMMVGDHPMSPFGRTEAVFDDEYWQERAQRVDHEINTLRAQVAALREAMTNARDSLRFVRTWSKYIDLQGVLTTTPFKEDFWAWAEGWDCDLELRMNAALAAVPAPPVAPAPERGEEGG